MGWQIGGCYDGFSPTFKDFYDAVGKHVLGNSDGFASDLRCCKVRNAGIILHSADAVLLLT